MDKETLRMHLHAGIITQMEYKDSLQELENPTEKDSLNENFVGTPMVGDIFDRTKTDYELAFEHYMNEGEEREEMEDTNEDEIETLSEELYDFVRDIKSALGSRNSRSRVESYLGRSLSWDEASALQRAGVIR